MNDQKKRPVYDDDDDIPVLGSRDLPTLSELMEDHIPTLESDTIPTLGDDSQHQEPSIPTLGEGQIPTLGDDVMPTLKAADIPTLAEDDKLPVLNPASSTDDNMAAEIPPLTLEAEDIQPRKHKTQHIHSHTLPKKHSPRSAIPKPNTQTQKADPYFGDFDGLDTQAAISTAEIPSEFDPFATDVILDAGIDLSDLNDEMELLNTPLQESVATKPADNPLEELETVKQAKQATAPKIHKVSPDLEVDFTALNERIERVLQNHLKQAKLEIMQEVTKTLFEAKMRSEANKGK